VGEETFRICDELVDDMIIVNNDEICAAIENAFEDTRSMLEPAVCLGLYYAMLYYTVLYYTTLHYTVLYYMYISLYGIVLYLYYTTPYYTILYYTIRVLCL